LTTESDWLEPTKGWVGKVKGTNLIDIVVVLKGFAEFAGLLLIGRGLVFLLSFGKHEVNAVYLMFRFLTSPMIKGARLITPAMVADRHVPFVATMLLFWIWLFLTYMKYSITMGATA
jgi:hypothetical protein